MQTQQSAIPTTNRLERNITLSLAAVEIESEITARLKKIARNAKMPGFRPGKVPFNIVANQYGFQVRQEVMSDVVKKSFAQAVNEQSLRVAGYPRFSPVNTGQSADKFEFNATFEIYPDVVIGDLAGQKLIKPEAVVSDSDVDHTLETLRKQRATYEKVERAAEAGDFLTIDFRGTLNGEAFKGGEAQNFGVVIGEKRMLPDFEQALIGMKAGTEKVFDLTFPADYQEDFAGKTAQFTVLVKVVNAPQLPAIDTEFAKSLGVEDGDIGKMRAEIKANLDRELKKRILTKVKDQVMDALIAVSKLDLPRSLVDIEISRLQQAAVKDLEARGMTAKDLSLPPELFMERAEKRVRLGLLLNEIVKQNNLKAQPAQIRAVVEDHAESFEEPQQMVRWYYNQPDRLAEIEAMVLEDNVVEWASAKMNVSMEKSTFDAIMGIDRQ